MPTRLFPFQMLEKNVSAQAGTSAPSHRSQAQVDACTMSIAVADLVKKAKKRGKRGGKKRLRSRIPKFNKSAIGEAVMPQESACKEEITLSEGFAQPAVV